MGEARHGVEQRPVSRRESHAPPASVELRLAPVLPLLQQRPHFRRHAADEGRSGLAGPGGGGPAGAVLPFFHSPVSIHCYKPFPSIVHLQGSCNITDSCELT